MKKITLQVNGRKMTFSEEELTAILEKYFGDKTSEPEEQANTFDVIPSSIDRSLFKKKKKDPKQEWTRQIILEAFDEVDRHPEKYAKPFKTSIPEKTWSATKTAGELKSLAKKLGDHIANWVEQALEWAQRIFNGETWKAVCNDPDTEKWYRMVVWKNGDCRLVGGSVNCSDNIPVSGVYCIGYGDDDIIYYTVPLVVSYEEDSPLLDRIAS